MRQLAVTLEQLEEFMAKLPFNHHLGLRVTGCDPDGVTIECPVLPRYGNMHGTLHGGVTATLIDVAGGFTTIALYGFERPATTVELKVNYLAPIRGERAIARSRVLRAGRQLCVVQVEVDTDDGTLAAAGLVTYMALGDSTSGR